MDYQEIDLELENKKLYCVRIYDNISLCGRYNASLRYLNLIKSDTICPKCKKIINDIINSEQEDV